MPIVQIPIGNSYQRVGTANPSSSTPPATVNIQGSGSSTGVVLEGGWQADGGLTIPTGFYLFSATFTYDNSIGWPWNGALPDPSDDPWAVWVTRDGADITTGSAWDALPVNANIAQKQYRAVGSSTTRFTYNLLTLLRDAWDYGKGAESVIPELRFTIHNTAGLPAIQNNLSNPRLILNYQPLPDWTVGSVFGSESLQNTTWSRATASGTTFGSETKITVVPPFGPGVTFGEATKAGLIIVAAQGLEAGSRTVVSSKTPTKLGVTFGGTADVQNRILVRLRLLAGKVAQDPGYMWIPVYLQLEDDDEADTPLEFFYADGTVIPHVVRNNYDDQVRTLVYMRPSVTEYQDFYVRIG